ncbi:MAG: hypothetical protein HMLKMBBP_01088 [Planctomycetes bacterium]|nr:hypothetical protein [Planctomycetota bacterium]
MSAVGTPTFTPSRPASQGDASRGAVSLRRAPPGHAPHRPGLRFAVSLNDVTSLWRTPAGSALVDAVLAGQKPDDAEVVEIGSVEALVLRGTFAHVAALASGFASAPLPATDARTARVFANDGTGWRRARVEDLAMCDEVAAGEGGRPTWAPLGHGPERASFARASRFHTPGEAR